MRATADCIAGCRLEDLFADSKFLRAEVLNPKPTLSLDQMMLRQRCAICAPARGAWPPGTLPGGCTGRQPAPPSPAWSARPPVCSAGLRRGRVLQRTSEAVRRASASVRRRSWSWCAQRCMRRGRWGASLPRARARTRRRRERALWPHTQGCGSGGCASALLPDSARALTRCSAVRVERVGSVAACCEEVVWSGRRRASVRPRAAAVHADGGRGSWS